MSEFKKFHLKKINRFILYLTVILSINGSTISKELVIDESKFFGPPLINECKDGFEAFSNFTCTGFPAIPPEDQNDREGFWSACKLRTCSFRFLRPNATDFATSISILAYFTGNVSIDIEFVPERETRKLYGTGWQTNTLDLTQFVDYERIENIKITPVYMTPQEFVIIDRIIFQIGEPDSTTTVPTIPTTTIPTTTIPTTTIPTTTIPTTTIPTTTIPTTTIPTTTIPTTTIPTTTIPTTTEPTITIPTSTPPITTEPTITTKTTPITTPTITQKPSSQITSTASSIRTSTEKLITTTITSIPNSPDPSTSTQQTTTSKPSKTFWRISNPIVILVFIVLPVILLILVSSCIICYARNHRIPSTKLKNDKDEDYLYRRSVATTNPINSGQTVNINVSPLAGATTTTAIPYDFEKQDVPRERGTRGAKTNPSAEPIYSVASVSKNYGYGVGQQMLPRLTRK